MPATWGSTSQESIASECERRGQHAVVCSCIDLLEGREVDHALVLALGGPHAKNVLAGSEGGKGGYWPRVWAARALLYTWDDLAKGAIVGATCDESWRVRELAAKVIARRQVNDGLGAVAKLCDDPVERVRWVAEKTIVALGAGLA